MARDASPLGQFTLDKTPYYQADTVVAATTGTKAQEAIVCHNLIEALQKLYAMALKEYNELINELAAFRAGTQITKKITPKIFNFQEKRLTVAEKAANLIMVEMRELCDSTNLNKLVVNVSARMFVDAGLATPNYINFCKKIQKIATRASEIKLDAKKNQESIVIDIDSSEKATLMNFPFTRVKYCLEIYVVLPGTSEKIILDSFLSEIAVTRLFDDSTMPIYSVLFLLPYDIIRHLKLHNDKVKWFININMLNKHKGDENTFQIPTPIILSQRLTPINPIYEAPETYQPNESAVMPRFPFKVDLVPYSDVKINSQINARVFTNVRMFDVIGAVISEAKAEFKKSNDAINEQLDFVVDPPDNLQVYEQILIEPGSFNQVINTLQSKYGIYNTGVRIDSHPMDIHGDGKEIVHFVSVYGKGNEIPYDKGLKEVYIDVVDPKMIDSESQITEPFFQSGQYISDDKTTMVLRTYNPYSVNRLNSDGLINGESVRVMYSSANDHFNSRCDTVESEMEMAKIFWSKYENVFALTQIQNSINEGQIEVTLNFNDINAMALNGGSKYRLKFYGSDDKVYSGDYRITKLMWYYRFGGQSVKAINDIEISCVATFVNVAEIRIEGAEVVKIPYANRVQAALKDIMAGRNVLSVDGSIDAIVRSTNIGKDLVTPPAPQSPPFKPAFRGRLDYNGKEIPGVMEEAYQLSNQLTIKEVYTRSNSPDYVLATVLMQDYSKFINAQRFANEIVEPIMNIAGGNLGLDSPYYSWLNPTGTDQQTICLGIRSNFGCQDPEALADLFVKLTKANLGFDDLVLEVMNNENWSAIYIDKNMNGTNKGRIYVTLPGGVNKNLNMEKVKSASDLKIDEIMKVVK